MSVLVARLLLAVALLGTVGSTLWNYPHQLAYFNELAGGPYEGWRHMLGSSLDWGQDFHYFRLWRHVIEGDAKVAIDCCTSPGSLFDMYPDCFPSTESDLDSRSRKSYRVTNIVRLLSAEPPSCVIKHLLVQVDTRLGIVSPTIRLGSGSLVVLCKHNN